MSNDRLKFRAWHRGNKAFAPAMIYPEDGCQGQVFKWLESGQPVEIMQWTGLYDEQDSEIYHKDFISDGHFVWLVEWAKSQYICRLVSHHNNVIHNNNLNVLLGSRQRAKMPASVIGNFYENPELINA